MRKALAYVVLFGVGPAFGFCFGSALLGWRTGRMIFFGAVLIEGMLLAIRWAAGELDT